MQEQISFIISPDGLRLFTRIWSPEDRVIHGVVYLVHGYAEHSGRYKHVAEYLVEAGFVVAALDHRGHGKSEGKRVWATSMDQFVEDINFWIENVKRNYSGLPQFLLAHSMGALISVLYCIKKKPTFTGVILSAAAVKISEDFSPLLQKLAPIISALLPKLPTTKIDPALLATDPSVGEKFVRDPLNYSGGILAGFGWITLKATREVGELFNQFDFPVLILHGAEDRLSDPQGSRDFYRLAKSDDKCLKIYEGLQHEILNESQKAMVLVDIGTWLKAHL